jgi:hypothetical protein
MNNRLGDLPTPYVQKTATIPDILAAPMTLRLSEDGSEECALLYRNETYGVQMEVHTDTRTRKRLVLWYIDGLPDEFNSAQAMAERYVTQPGNGGKA